MLDKVYGFPIKDILKIRKLINEYCLDDIDTLLSCFDEEKLNDSVRNKLLKEEIELINF